MSSVLVTGGTGALGRELVPRLVAAGHDVSVLSRHGNPSVPSGVTAVRGNLVDGSGLAEATSGVDVIAHLASGTGGVPSYKKAKRTDVDGTARLVDAAKENGVKHVVYISIVGIDKIPLGYYRGKLEAERVIEQSGVDYTILRTTQWHTLAEEFCRRFASFPVVFAPKGMRMQLLDVGEVADRMARLVGGPPARRVADMGGPYVLEFGDIIRRYLTAVGKRRVVLSLPLPGKTAGAFAKGFNLAPQHAVGTTTWDDYLSRLT
jgi:uncharacterized protein YbjT (DUF2867 family)